MERIWPIESSAAFRGILKSGTVVATVAPRPAGEVFVIETPNVEVRVLGTRFVVRYYPEENKTGVLVYEGAVTIFRGADSRPVIFEAGMGGSFGPARDTVLGPDPGGQRPDGDPGQRIGGGNTGVDLPPRRE